MEVERPRKMELLHTPKSEIAKQMKENSLTVEEVIFLFSSNKITAIDIRNNGPSLCDKLLNMSLREMSNAETNGPKMAPAVTSISA